MSHTLLIPLVGPMQAWGSRSRFDDRDTHPEPTKSAVLGLVCAALGRRRGEPIADLTALRFGVRVDAPGTVLTDFHTAQEVIRAAGTGTSAVTSRRHYLSDARFLAGLQGADLNLLAQIEHALHSPIWALALGRRSFPLALPPFLPGGSLRQGVALEEALRMEPWRPLTALRDWESAPTELRLVLEDSAGEDGVISDQAVDFASRRFGLRRIRTGSVAHVNEGEPWCTFPR